MRELSDLKFLQKDKTSQMAESNRQVPNKNRGKVQAIPVNWWTARITMPDAIGSTTMTFLHDWLVDNTKEWYFQYERGENGEQRHHFQILFKTLTKSRKTNLIGTRKWVEKVIEPMGAEPVYYLEPCSTGASEATKRYVTKHQSRVEGPWSSVKIYLGTDLACMSNPYPWQKFVLDTIASPPDDRSVVWLYDPEGNKGKSKLVKYLAHNKLAKSLQVETASRLASALCDQGPMESYVVDIPRTLCKDKSITSVIMVIEGLKNGHVVDNMYGKNREMLFMPPHVFVLSNFPPPREMLSPDRWRVFKLTADFDIAAVPAAIPQSPIDANRDMILDESQDDSVRAYRH